MNFGQRMIAIEEVNKQKEGMYDQLNEKDKVIEMERQQKLEMEKLLKEME